MALTIVETPITGGVDTHADTHVAAALDPVGGLLGVAEFPATAAGYARLLGWLGGFGTVCLVGIEGTGSYGAGLARHVTAAGIRVVEVDRSDRQDRRRQGKSDPLDAVSAARAAQSGRAAGAPKGRDGAVEAIRALMVAKRSARSERVQTINQARALVLTGPEDLRTRFARHTAASLVSGLASLRPRPGDVVGYATRIALRELGRRAEFLDGQLERLDELIAPLVAARAPGLLALHGAGPRHRRPAPGRRRGSPGAAALRGGLGAPVRGRPDPGIAGESHSSPPQSRRRPPGQPRPMADRAHTAESPSADSHLCRAAHHGRLAGERDHPLPQALRRPRGLPLPAPARRLTQDPRGRPGPLIGCRTRWPANDSPAVPGPILTRWA